MSADHKILSAFEVLGSMPALLCVCREGNVTAVNKHGAALLGCAEPADLEGTSFESLLADEYQGLGESLLDMIAEEDGSIRLKLAKNWGAATDLEVSAIMQGKLPVGVHVIYGIDISEKITSVELLHQRERRFRTIIDNASCMICEAVDGTVISINAAGLKLLGIPAPDAYVGTPVSNLFLSEYHELFETELSALSQEDAPVPVRLRHSDGTVRDVEVIVTSLDGAVGRNLLLEIRDISAQNKALQALRELNESLEARVEERTRTLREAQERLNRISKLEAVGTFAGGVAHEINTPIQFLADNLKFLQTGIADLTDVLSSYSRLSAMLAEGKDTVDAINEAKAQAEAADMDFVLDEVPSAISQSITGVTHIAKVVQAMRDFADRREAVKSMLDLGDLIASEVGELRGTYQGKAPIEFTPPKEPIVIEAAEEELRQAIGHLVDNAVRAVEEKGQGTVTVALRRDGPHVKLNVTDDGVGMSAEIASKAFDPFFTTREVGDGIGQGLAITHHIVKDRHQGEIQIQSTQNGGTNVEITLACPDMPDCIMYEPDGQRLAC